MMSQTLMGAVRSLARTPVWSSLCVLCAAVGAVCAALIFGAARLLLAPPPGLRHAESLISVGIADSGSGIRHSVSQEVFLAWSRESSSFEALAASVPDNVSVDAEIGGREALSLQAGVVSWNYFDVMGLAPLLGMGFSERDEEGAPSTVVISESLWRGRFAARRQAIGSRIDLNGRPYIVEGIMPDVPFSAARLWVTGPGRFSQILNVAFLISPYVEVTGRLKNGVIASAAASELSSLLTQSGLRDLSAHRNSRAVATPFSEVLTAGLRGPARLVWIVGMSAFLISLGNAAVILLLRAQERRKEIALRLMLGAGPGRVVGILCAEGCLITCAAAALAALLYPILARVLPSLGFADLPAGALSIGAPAAVALLVGAGGFLMIANFAPAWVLVREDYAEILKERAAAVTPSVRGARLRALMAGGQLAMCIALIALSALLAKSAYRILNVDLGLDAHDAILAKAILPGPGFTTVRDQAGFSRGIVGRLSAMPGVEAAGAVSFFPLEDAAFPVPVRTIGGPPLSAELSGIAGDYFRAAGIQMLRGHSFAAGTAAIEPGGAIVDASLARLLDADENVLGRVIEVGGIKRRVVGVCGAIGYRGLGERPAPMVYIPADEFPMPFPYVTFVVRSPGEGGPMERAIRRIVAQAGSEHARLEIDTVQAIVDHSRRAQAVALRLIAMLGGISLALALVGTAAVAAQSIRQREREIGIRLALGARPFQAMRPTLSSLAAAVVLAGIGGALLAFALAHVLSAVIYGVSPADWLAYTAVIAGVSSAAALAGTLPLRRLSAVPVSELLSRV